MCCTASIRSWGWARIATADDSFQRLTYGGYLMRQGLSQSVPTRIVANRTMERQLLFDIDHPDAFRTSGKFHTALLDEQDFAMNRAAFTENGYSKGMFYNTYCNARVTLSDGRVYVFGGHDMQSNNGLYKVNIFDPNTEDWVPRSEPCTRSKWTSDPFGQDLFAADPLAPHLRELRSAGSAKHAAVRSVGPEVSRWYPSAIPLPNDWVLVVGGFDQDNTVPPDPNRVAEGETNQSSRTRRSPRPRQHRRAGSLRSEVGSEHRARERAHGVPALSAARGRPDRSGQRRLERMHAER